MQNTILYQHEQEGQKLPPGCFFCTVHPTGITFSTSDLITTNLQLGYNLPASITQKLHIQRLRVYANAQNAVNIFGYKGFNPEVGRTSSTVSNATATPTTAGIDNSIYPLFATYNLGINVTF